MKSPKNPERVQQIMSNESDDPKPLSPTDEPCQEFRGQTVLQIEAVHNLHKVRMYFNILSLRSTS